MEKENVKEFMFVHSVAKKLCCTEKHVYELIKQGKLKAIRLGKAAIRVSKVSVNEFIENNEIDPDEYLDQN